MRTPFSTDPAPRPESSPARWLARRPGVRDCLLAAALAGLGFVPTLSAIGVELGDLPEHPTNTLSVVLLLGQCAPLAVRRRWPAACLALVGTAFALDQALAFPPTFASVGLYFALYATGAHLERFRRCVAVVATVGFAVTAATLSALGSPNRPADFLAFYLVLVVIWMVGTGVRRWRTEDVERRRLAAAVATADERSRIARELHDVVTHHVTAMVIQADALQYLLPPESDRATNGLAAISDTGRRALTELRYLLGVLETDRTAHATRTPTLGRVVDLVEDARRSAQPVEWTADSGRAPLPDAVELAAYRVVQEGLTNALKHAPGRPTTVRLHHGIEHLEVEVTTEGDIPSGAGPAAGAAAGPVQPSGGRGLAGLRERVRVLGGDLETDLSPDGGFRLRALLPSTPTGRRR